MLLGAAVIGLLWIVWPSSRKGCDLVMWLGFWVII